MCANASMLGVNSSKNTTFLFFLQESTNQKREKQGISFK